jgi:hypothetical protein
MKLLDFGGSLEAKFFLNILIRKNESISLKQR